MDVKNVILMSSKREKWTSVET